MRSVAMPERQGVGEGVLPDGRPLVGAHDALGGRLRLDRGRGAVAGVEEGETAPVQLPRDLDQRLALPRHRVDEDSRLLHGWSSALKDDGVRRASAKA